MKKYKIGYTQGVFDMFHIGHLNLINQAKGYCEILFVGVNSDSLVKSYKNKIPVINEKNRRIIIENLKAVDKCFVVSTLDKLELWKKYQFDAIFIGDDWKDNMRWQQTEMDLKPHGVEVVYLPYTVGVSSTILRSEKDNKVEE